MKFTLNLSLLLFFILYATSAFNQRSKNGNYNASALNTVVNSYTYLTANAAAGATSLTVNNNTLTNSVLASALAPGDLILIIQMQGASMDIDVTASAPLASGGWNGDYTTPTNLPIINWHMYAHIWGNVTNYNNSGKFEQAEVLSVSGSNTITLHCPLLNNYTASGHVQIIRVPRFQDVTIANGASIVPRKWDGQIGGVVAMEVSGDLTVTGTGKISASAAGFRGGVADNVGGASSGVSTGVAAAGTGIGDTYLASKLGVNGARKGEGIGGYTTEYAALYSVYGRSAPANGGGGAGYQNAGGGGGSNVGTGTYTGKGVPDPTYATAWNLELVGFGSSSSSGGGRGGYTLSSANRDELAIGPNRAEWGAGYRKPEGGLGGHPLTYDNSRIFMGGGGGAGDQDNGQGGSGGQGGGIVFLTVYGSISGAGTIEADGGNGLNSNPNDEVPMQSQRKGNDGAGGAGGGGSIYIKNSTAVPNTIVLNAKGGKGGDNKLSIGSFSSNIEANGPGAGGAGGAVALTAGSPIQTVTGGASGITTVANLVSTIANFPPNGATQGASGMSGLTTTIYDILAQDQEICLGKTATLTATVTGTMPVGGTVLWYAQRFGGSSIGSGLTFTTPVLTGTTTYYVGICPGTFRIPVKVTVNPNPIISGTAVVTNEACGTPGKIVGLSVVSGTTPYTFKWNTTTTPTIDLTTATIGSYTLTVTDSKGCSDTDGPYTIVSANGPTVDVTNAVITKESCSGTKGSISGIAVSGGTSPYTYSWSNGGGTSVDASNLTAGTFTLTVTDQLGCVTVTAPFTVGFIAGPDIVSSGVTFNTASCGQSNGSISGITATGTGLTYFWNGLASATLDLQNQAAGSYSLVVKDANGCSKNAGPFVINSTGDLAISEVAAVLVHDHCSRAMGSISGLTITGGTAPLTYTWTNSTQVAASLSNLSAGNYQLTVKDVQGCTAISSVFVITNISGPTIDLTNVVKVNEKCSDGNASISGITASGVGLLYTWTNNGGSALNATNLDANTYELTVTDQFGCTANSGPIVLTDAPGPVINVAQVALQQEICGNKSGSISGIVVQGTQLTYAWTNNAGTSLNASNLGAGVYNLTVKDGNGCEATAGPFTITNSGAIQIVTTSLIATDEHCGRGDGAIQGLTATGGSGTLSYSWTNTTQTTLNISNLSAASYVLTVSDPTGCKAISEPVLIANIAGPTLNQASLLVKNESCNLQDGAISGITATGSNLTYSWSNSTQTTSNISNLVPGVYILTVTDGNGCKAVSSPVTINAAVGMTLQTTNAILVPTFCSSATGAITGIKVIGGVNPTYLWSNGSTTLDISSLSAGTYQLTVKDDQGCLLTYDGTITTAPSPVIDLSQLKITEEHCGLKDGSISGLKITGGTPDFRYVWNQNPNLNTLAISDLTVGSYELLVVDHAGCEAKKLFNVIEGSKPTADFSTLIKTDLTCTALGSIKGIVPVGSGPFTYLWNNNKTTLDIDGLQVGSYTLTLADVYGCKNVLEPIVLLGKIKPEAEFYWGPLRPSFDVKFNLFNTSTNAVNYRWQFGDGTNSTLTEPTHTYTNAKIKTYPVMLIAESKDGCFDTARYTIEMNDELLFYAPNSFTPNGDQFNNVFQPIVAQGIDFFSYDLLIFNRWGETVFESRDANIGWDGTYNGEVQQDGVYTWTVTFRTSQTDEKKLITGIINLIK